MRTATGILIRLGLIAIFIPGAALAQPVCDHLTLTAARTARLFVDGFESGDTLPWALPVVPAFSAGATEDLLAETTLLGDASGEHLLTLRWMLPGEHLYQESSLPFTSDAGATGERRIPNYPFPMALRSPGRGVRTVAGALVVEQRLPVAGTPILESAVLGRWRVLVFVDGQEEACMAAIEFDLER